MNMINQHGYQRAIENELDRVRQMMTEAIANVEIDGGDIRLFSFAILAAAIELHREVEGSEGIYHRIEALVNGRDSHAGGPRQY